MQQKTIKKSVEISGFGLHNGKSVNMKINPAKEDSGIYFIRNNFKKNIRIEASLNNVFETHRATSLKKHNIQIKTTEHFLAACWHLSIDNLEVEINNEELPILDGSSSLFIKALNKVGVKEQKKQKEIFKIKNYMKVSDTKSGAFIECMPANNFEISATIDYQSNIIEKQTINFNESENFDEKIGSAKTFFLIKNSLNLQEIKKIKGGNLENSLVFLEQDIHEKEINTLNIDTNQKIFKKGIINPAKMSFENECARHKVLDIIGDIYLLQKKIIGKIIAYKPGHSINLKLTQEIKKNMEREKKGAPKYNLKEKPLMNIERIKQILPHRDPFLLIDEVRELEHNYVVGIKYVRIEEDYFRGHFPNEPVMPGVLQIEAMAQTGGILALNTVPDPENYLTYFMKIDNVKFKQKVVPSDVLIFELKLLSPIRRGICHMHGKAYVNNKVVMEAELMAKISKDDK